MRDARETVIEYINALDGQDYERARQFLSDSVHVIGPAGESFSTPAEFVGMLKTFGGKYDIKRIFADGNDVCLLYDYLISGDAVYMSSWYSVETEKITFIRTIFDPGSIALKRD